MIAKKIIGYLKTVDYEVLKNKASQFKWTGHGEGEIDGPAILWILLQICNPSTRVGVAAKIHISQISLQCQIDNRSLELEV